jgi:hypothetical protein
MEVHVAGASMMSISFGKIMTTVEAPIAEHHHDEGITSLLHRIRSEFIEMPDPAACFANSSAKSYAAISYPIVNAPAPTVSA